MNRFAVYAYQWSLLLHNSGLGMHLDIKTVCGGGRAHTTNIACRCACIFISHLLFLGFGSFVSKSRLLWYPECRFLVRFRVIFLSPFLPPHTHF